MVQVNNKHRCSVCNSEINAYEFYMSEDKKQYFCSVDCAEQRLEESNFMETITGYGFCPAYRYCKQLDNIRGKCTFKHELTKSQFSASHIPRSYESPNYCSPAETSQIISNVKLFNYVKRSEEDSAELNKSSFELNKSTYSLTRVMLFVSIANLILIVVQIYLQVSSA